MTLFIRLSKIYFLSGFDLGAGTYRWCVSLRRKDRVVLSIVVSLRDVGATKHIPWRGVASFVDHPYPGSFCSLLLRSVSPLLQVEEDVGVLQDKSIGCVSCPFSAFYRVGCVDLDRSKRQWTPVVQWLGSQQFRIVVTGE